MVNRVLGELKVSHGGKELGRHCKMPGMDNFSVVTERINARLNDIMGIKSRARDKASEEQLEAALAQLDGVADAVRDEIRTARKGS